MSARGVEPRTQRPCLDLAELAETPNGAVRAIGRLRLPVTLTAAPWATLYAYPDGRRAWKVRLWELDRPVTRLLPTDRLRNYARRSGLRSLLTEMDELLARADARIPADASKP